MAPDVMYPGPYRRAPSPVLLSASATLRCGSGPTSDSPASSTVVPSGTPAMAWATRRSAAAAAAARLRGDSRIWSPSASTPASM
ncbi:hypothetical protein D0T12_00720 [Actinomadura spongiicola]|uniref:Uncharacterized protein n=1 Tax=Actinomadura spongiicola TaxID=2303421 RepID=A0A372GNW5_9ACTN|nr:hypothetical protein D0T12_00720 [Actinomadura spongiicola]